MAFPTTGVLDGGTSPVENPISTGGWTGPTVTGQQPLQRTATGIARGSALGGSYRTDSPFGPNAEVYATIAVLTAGTNTDEGTMHLRLSGQGTANINSYSVWIRASSTASSDRLRIGRDVNSVTTILGTYIIGTIVPGVDQYGLQVIGDQLTAYYNNGSGWAAVLGPITDATHSSAGTLSIQTQRSDTRLTDFGGGTIPTLSSDAPPFGFSGRGAGC
jgi:hypothetical protein